MALISSGLFWFNLGLSVSWVFCAALLFIDVIWRGGDAQIETQFAWRVIARWSTIVPPISLALSVALAVWAWFEPISFWQWSILIASVLVFTIMSALIGFMRWLKNGGYEGGG